METPYKYDTVELLERDVPLMRSSTGAETEAAHGQHGDEHELGKRISQQATPIQGQPVYIGYDGEIWVASATVRYALRNVVAYSQSNRIA